MRTEKDQRTMNGLRLSGWSFADIAERFGYARSSRHSVRQEIFRFRLSQLRLIWEVRNLNTYRLFGNTWTARLSDKLDKI